MRGIAGDFLVLSRRFGKGPVIATSYRTGWKIPRNPPHPPRGQYAPRVICDVRRWKEASMTSVHAFVWSARAGALALFALCVHAQAQTDPLPSWNEGPSKQAIVEFVKATTDKASPKFVPPEARIATFDQDGTN